jgi:two-component system, LytTR family, response regulator
MRVMIVDDEPLARLRLRTLLEKEGGIEIVGEAENGAEALEVVRTTAPDLIFLDVQMPGMSGFDVIRSLGSDRLPAVIFVTAFDNFALEAFETHALDYLLKPFSDERFASALERAMKQIQREREGDLHLRLRKLVASIGEERSYPKRLAVRTGVRTAIVRTEEIEWIEAEGKYVRIHAGGRSHLMRDALGRLEELLDPERFCRIHRSYIVNMDRIKEIQNYSAGEYVVVLQDGTKLMSGRSYRSHLLTLLGKES